MRIRTVKPEFWRSDDIARLPREIRLLFIGLWSYVDDNGVGIDDYRQVTADLFPLDDDIADTREFVREGLATLSRASLIVRYEVAGKSYLHVPTWERHQKIDKPGKPRYPRPDAVTSGDAPKDDCSRDPRETLAPVTEDQGNRGAEEKAPSSPGAAAPVKPPRDDVEQLCTRLADRMEGNGAKRPNITDSWRRAARLLLDKDGRPLDQALRLLDWCQEDSFWLTNIHSLPTFRDQYDKLLMKARQQQQERQKGNRRVVATSDERAAAVQALKTTTTEDDHHQPALPASWRTG